MQPTDWVRQIDFVTRTNEIIEYKVQLVFMVFSLSADMEIGRVGCMRTLGITESLAVKRRVVYAASEAAEMIMRVDNIIRAAPRQRQQDRSRC
jgi:hypothetical protein